MAASVTGVVLLAAAGVRTAPQVLIQPLEAEFGWMRADISLAVAVSILWFGLGVPISGTLVGRFGLRAIMTSGLLVIAAALGLMSWMDSLWQLHLFSGPLSPVSSRQARTSSGRGAPARNSRRVSISVLYFR